LSHAHGCPCHPPTTCALCEQAKALLEHNDIEQSQWWVYVLVLVAIIVAFRSLAMLLLSRRAAASF